MLDDSMPLLPPVNDVGIKLAGANEDAAVSEKSMPLLVGRWEQDTCDQKAGKSRIGGPTSTFTKLLATGRWQGEPVADRRITQLHGGHLSDSQRVDRTAVQTVRLARF